MDTTTPDEQSWLQHDFGLDNRLIKALSKLNITYPTLVQAKAIPIALEGKDILIRARTGSGKTIAFGLPALQKIISAKNANSNTQGIQCIILAPTKELVQQIETHIGRLLYYCRDLVKICSVADDNNKVRDYVLSSQPDILVSTPAKLVKCLKSVDLSRVQTLVIDEADLVLSFGYAEDVRKIVQQLPKVYQGLLVSATLSPELEKFKRVVLHNPAVLKLEETENSGKLLQFYIDTTEQDKYLIVYVFIKLGLLQVRTSKLFIIVCTARYAASTSSRIVSVFLQ